MKSGPEDRMHMAANFSTRNVTVRRISANMATDERNFRSVYYEKVGCRGVGETNKLENLLKEKLVDQGKLKQFCIRFAVPVRHRSLLWCSLLNIRPMYTNSLQYVMTQRKAVYNDLLHALKMMRLVDEAKMPKSRILYAMWLLETKRLHLGFNISTTEHNFIGISETLLQLFDDEVEIYWMAKKFYEITEDIEKDLPKLITLTTSLFEKNNQELFRYLETHNLLQKLPLNRWYVTCFSGVLNETALAKVWDKIIGGSFQILAFVLYKMLSKLERSIYKCKDIDSLLECIEKLNAKNDQEMSDVIVSKSIEMWQSSEFFYKSS
ncbi:TBC1 domain family member 7 [Phlebotomus argentipes]|uniref:TBC1 domain family member 7 n=1 Tax=Phlebotomus argentipes TaxID=94469 RepID=UPI002893562B|nr:TBC1 domain family member 7 [Phlebotomus argentipes]